MTRQFRELVRIEAEEGGWIVDPLFTANGMLNLSFDPKDAGIIYADTITGRDLIENAGDYALIIHPLPEDQWLRLHNTKELPL